MRTLRNFVSRTRAISVRDRDGSFLRQMPGEVLSLSPPLRVHTRGPLKTVREAFSKRRRASVIPDAKSIFEYTRTERKEMARRGHWVKRLGFSGFFFSFLSGYISSKVQRKFLVAV